MSGVEDVYSFSVDTKLPALSLAINYQQQDKNDQATIGNQQYDQFSFALNAVYSGAYLHYESLSVDGADDPNLLTIGYTFSLGKNTSVWLEYADYDTDTATGSTENFEVILKYDI